MSWEIKSPSTGGGTNTHSARALVAAGGVDLSNAHISLPLAQGFTSRPFTLHIDYRAEAARQHVLGALFSQWQPMGGRRSLAVIPVAQGLRIYRSSDGTSELNDVVGDFPGLDRWINLIVTYDGATLVCYADGVEFFREEIILWASSTPFELGRFSEYWFMSFGGQLRNLILFSRALDETEVGYLHQTGIIAPSLHPKLVDAWAFDDGLPLYQGRNGGIAVPSRSMGATRRVNDLISRGSASYRLRVANPTDSAAQTELIGFRPAKTQISRIAFRQTHGSGSFRFGTSSNGNDVTGDHGGSTASGVAHLTGTAATSTQASLWVRVAANTTYEFTITYDRIGPLL